MNPKRRRIIELAKPKFILADPENPAQYRTKPASKGREKALEAMKPKMEERYDEESNSVQRKPIGIVNEQRNGKGTSRQLSPNEMLRALELRRDLDRRLDELEPILSGDESKDIEVEEAEKEMDQIFEKMNDIDGELGFRAPPPRTIKDPRMK